MKISQYFKEPFLLILGVVLTLMVLVVYMFPILSDSPIVDSTQSAYLDSASVEMSGLYAFFMALAAVGVTWRMMGRS